MLAFGPHWRSFVTSRSRTKDVAWDEIERGREDRLFQLVPPSRNQQAKRWPRANYRDFQTRRRIGARIRDREGRFTRSGQDHCDSIDPLALICDDRRTNGVLARDISKSLLLAAIPDTEQGPIHDLVEAIQSYAQNSDMIVFSKKPQKQPDLLTPGYQAYLGQQQLYTKELSSAVLTMENTEEGGAELLAIKVSVKWNFI
jgi:hypothetical protein